MSPSSSSTPRGWWSRPIATYPAKKDREPTCTEWFAFGTPYCGGLFTVVAILSIFLLIDRSPSHAKFSIQSINVSPSASAATWHVEFLVKNPSSRYSICYDGDDASVRLGLAKLFDSKRSCYLELFANSISVSNANASNADWRISFVARSPVSGCKFSLNTMQSRLLRGGEVISEISPLLDSFGQHVYSGDTYGPVTTVGFKDVVTPGLIGGVVRDFRVELVARVKTDSSNIYHRSGVLTVFCGGLPVKFTADPAGDVTGSLLGNMRRCEYLFRRDKRFRSF
ncbi:hypothetical protein AALP_AA8G234700 [Arabis alpina]|uniref:Late embryogenesis abundant protein LEA-2 subgroup domain-containing protein n=1 Tax=Arabis alpina TaxID=50452 RepID=A0A087G8Y5_ARAAL|nr:hypothetical protein AALP_AA8G234700 [Arabis alpina]